MTTSQCGTASAVEDVMFTAWLGNDIVDVRIPGWVLPSLDRVNRTLRNVHAPNGEARIMEANGRGQTDVAETDDTDGHVGV